MAKTDALVSGSVANQLFEMLKSPGSRLDIFVQDGQGPQDLAENLTNVESYTRNEAWDGITYHSTEIETVERIPTFFDNWDRRSVLTCSDNVIQQIRSFQSRR